MSTTLSPSSPSDNQIPTATLALPSSAAASRRLPPPCWSPDETVALIDAYREKWYSLRRGNLRANHWQEVADHVAARCPVAPPKTAVQCRHKMEKLRKRYRGEIQRAAAHGGVRRFASSWAHFQSMHSMEKGPNPTPPSSDDEEEDDRNYPNPNYPNFGGVRIKIPGRVKLDEIPNCPNPRFANGKRGGEMPSERKGGSAVGELVEAIETLGEGFMRMEKVKMDMVRQIEEMRMEMELKRTEMILESEERIVEAFAKAISERSAKRAKRNSNNSTTPEC